jgi:hypothetical protein
VRCKELIMALQRRDQRTLLHIVNKYIFELYSEPQAHCAARSAASARAASALAADAEEPERADAGGEQPEARGPRHRRGARLPVGELGIDLALDGVRVEAEEALVELIYAGQRDGQDAGADVELERACPVERASTAPG